MNDPQPVYEFDDVENHDRLTSFFRLILVIPHAIWAALWGFAAQLAVVLAWFAILFTGRYPAGLYRFVSGAHRYAAAVGGFAMLLTDRSPGFRVPADDAPVRLLIPEPKARYHRGLAFFRVIVGIPVYLISTVLGYAICVAGILNWFAILFTGRRFADFQALAALAMSYAQRANIYFALMTEQWPPLRTPGREGLTGNWTREPV